MNFNIIDKNTFIVKLNNSFLEINEQDEKDKLNKLLFQIKKRYSYDIYGFYDVDIYYINNFITIIKFKRKDDDEYFRKNINLKINRHLKEKRLHFNDYFLIDKYKNKIINNSLKGSDIDKKDILRLCEHYDIIY